MLGSPQLTFVPPKNSTSSSVRLIALERSPRGSVGVVKNAAPPLLLVLYDFPFHPVLYTGTCILASGKEGVPYVRATDDSPVVSVRGRGQPLRQDHPGSLEERAAQSGTKGQCLQR